MRASDQFFEDRIGQWMVPLARWLPGIRQVLGDLLACRQPYRGLWPRLARSVIRRPLETLRRAYTP